MLEGTREHMHVELQGHERSPAHQPRGVGTRADLGMLPKEGCSQRAAPLRSIAKHMGLAKHAEKHTFLRHRQNQSYSFHMYLSAPRNDY